MLHCPWLKRAHPRVSKRCNDNVCKQYIAVMEARVLGQVVGWLWGFANNHQRGTTIQHLWYVILPHYFFHLWDCLRIAYIICPYMSTYVQLACVWSFDIVHTCSCTISRMVHCMQTMQTAVLTFNFFSPHSAMWILTSTSPDCRTWPTCTSCNSWWKMSAVFPMK